MPRKVKCSCPNVDACRVAKPTFRTIGVFDENCQIVGRPLYGAVMTCGKAEKKAEQFQAKFPHLNVQFI